MDTKVTKERPKDTKNGGTTKRGELLSFAGTLGFLRVQRLRVVNPKAFPQFSEVLRVLRFPSCASWPTGDGAAARDILQETAMSQK